ncbi:MAG TPA: hypothetical protein VN635_15435 [Conexibacter sp.]|nr:hypothetical protein [Conexibacter sp.]
MRTAGKLILATLAATALFALIGGGALARNLSVSERNFEFIWNNAMTGKARLSMFDSAGLGAECKVTLLGRFVERTIVKELTRKIGELNHGETAECRESERSEMAFRLETPAEIRYRAFTGTLPIIRSVAIGVVGLRARIRERFGMECVMRTTALEPAVFEIEEITSGVLNNIRADETRTIRLNAEEPCAFFTPGRFTGRGLILNLPRITSLVLRLI